MDGDGDVMREVPLARSGDLPSHLSSAADSSSAVLLEEDQLSQEKDREYAVELYSSTVADVLDRGEKRKRRWKQGLLCCITYCQVYQGD